MNKVKIVADSKNEFGQRITSMVVTFPRFLLAEKNTHRALTRSSASSRAIRFEKMVRSVQDNPFIPFAWQKDHPGMQGTQYFTDQEVKDLELIEDHLLARDLAVQQALKQHSKGVTKQLCNRLLEPYLYHTALVTATEWENFFALRAHKDAEIHFQDLAEKMLFALNESEPEQLKAGNWHLPFDKFNPKDIEELAKNYTLSGFGVSVKQEIAIKLATVRCARISYKTQDGDFDLEKDLALYDRLSTSGHWSAFEHCARAMSEKEYYGHFTGMLNTENEIWPTARLILEHSLQHSDPQFGWCGNFRGFTQFRKMFPQENRTDSRLIKK